MKILKIVNYLNIYFLNIVLIILKKERKKERKKSIEKSLNYFKENKDKYKSLISIIKNLNNIWDIKINNRTFKDRDSFVDGFKKNKYLINL